MMSPRQVSWISQVVYWLAAMAGNLAMHNSSFHRVATSSLPANATLVLKKDVRSSLECASVCRASSGAACCSYGYNHLSKQCHLYSTCHSSVLTKKNGYSYFVPLSVYLLRVGDSCPTVGDCSVIANAECRESKCQCVAGYHFYPRYGTCVAACPSGYGGGFYKVKDMILMGHNIGSMMSPRTEDQCLAACKANSQCRAFECDGNSCNINDATPLQDPQAYEAKPGWSYYQMDCA